MSADEFEPIRREVLADARGTVVEIGVGPGYNLPIYTNVTKVYALEPSKELVEIAKGRAQSLSFPFEFLVTGAEEIPLADASVDTVVSTWTLCSVTDPEKVLSEIRRVLRAGGKFIFVEHGATHIAFLHGIQRILTPITKHFTGNCHYDRKMQELITGAGFTIEKMSHPKEKSLLIYNYQGVATKV